MIDCYARNEILNDNCLDPGRGLRRQGRFNCSQLWPVCASAIVMCNLEPVHIYVLEATNSASTKDKCDEITKCHGISIDSLISSLT